MKRRIEVIEGDITKLHVNAVNISNSRTVGVDDRSCVLVLDRSFVGFGVVLRDLVQPFFPKCV
jgi:hypothetical protein